MKQDINNVCHCMSQFYLILALSISIIRLVIFAILQVRRIKLCRGQLFSNSVKMMLFISDVQYYLPLRLCKPTGSIHLFKITGILTPDKVKLNKHYIWDMCYAEIGAHIDKELKASISKQPIRGQETK